MQAGSQNHSQHFLEVVVARGDNEYCLQENSAEIGQTKS